MDIMDIVNIIALCIACFSLGIEIGKDISNIQK